MLAPPLNWLLLCVFGEAAERVDQLRLLDRIAACFKKAGRADEISEALRTRDRSSCLVNLFVELSTDALACDDSAIRRTTSSRTGIRFSSLKNEIVHHRNYQTRDEARTEIFEYIELFYNRKRLHQSLNYQTADELQSVY